MADYDQPVLIAVPTLEGLITDIFAAAGCDRAEANRISTHLVGANLAGHDSHGVVRVPRYVESQQQGFVVAGQQAEIVTDGGAFALLDGKWGYGQTVAPQATALGIRSAFMNQPLEVPAVRPLFAADFGIKGQRPDLVVRFGRGPTMPRSLRRPIQAVLVGRPVG